MSSILSNSHPQRLNLLPGWAERLSGHDRSVEPVPIHAMHLPRSSSHYAGQISFIADPEAAQGMLELARQRPLAWIGFDTEFRYDRPGVVIDRTHTAYDPRSIRPLLLSLALAEPDARGDLTLYRFVVDLRLPELHETLAGLFRLPVCFVGHYAHVELLCLLQLGLPLPGSLWDSWVAEKALNLGRSHKKYKLPKDADPLEEVRADEATEEEERLSYSLIATCQRHAVVYPFTGDKLRLQQSFLDHPLEAPFTAGQIEYAAADAVAAGLLYPSQVHTTMQAGILQHLVSVEMPWVATNAGMAWRGVRVDADKARRVAEACARHLKSLQPKLAALGVPNVRSHCQLEAFFGQAGLLDLFRRNSKLSFDKNQLADFQDRHPAIPLIRAARRVHDLLKEKILSGEFVGADGRVHPEYRHLGTHTGRQTSRWPNILGLGRIFRPLIVPEAGRGLGEADWSQIEVGIAAAVYHDERLIAMFNSDDVHSAIAKDFYREQLSEDDRALPGKTFKTKFSEIRSKVKTCTLGIIYGLTPHGLALRLNIPHREAETLLERFMGRFPALKQALADAVAHGGLRGYATTVSGLRRYRARPGPLTNWERNWLANHPVQGTAAVIFKAAGNRLDQLYRSHDAWLLVPLHDAFLFESPLESISAVAELTRRVMCETVQEYFPELQPQVEVNFACPECWNKDGHADAIDRWIADPTYSF